MKVIKGLIRRLEYCIEFILCKIRYGTGFKQMGFIKGLNNLQIIVTNHGKLNIGKGCSFQKNVSLSSIGGELSIGNHVIWNRNCIAICQKEITIADNVIIGPGVTIYDHDHVFSKIGIESGYKTGSVRIDKGCWIAANVTILRNTHIGEGSVIGAGAIVKGNIPPHSLVTSNRSLTINPIS